MRTELTLNDVNEHLCRHCAHCCLSIRIPVPVDDRTFEFYKAVGLDISRDDENPETGILNVGACQYLIKKGKGYSCSIYEDRPKLCKQYNCVGWSNCADAESADVQYALKVYNEICSTD